MPGEIHDAEKDTSKPGREEEVIDNADNKQKSSEPSSMTGLPVKDKQANADTEGERRFKEGMANNNDTESE